MALLKQIELDNGVNVNYHRIVSINKITNSSIIIEVCSYISKKKRDEEIQKSLNNENMNVFKNTIYLNKEYKENDNIKDIYDYLKTLEIFKNSIDI